MTNLNTRLKAHSLKDEAAMIGEGLKALRDSAYDLSKRKNRVYLSQTKLPGFESVRFDGGARFDRQGQVKAIGVRHTNQNGSVCEFVLRTTRSRMTITKRIQHDESQLKVVTAQFNNDHQLLKYQEKVV